MPAKPLTREQQEDAARLRQAFRDWQTERRVAGMPISQMQAAARLGFGQSALSQYLNGAIPLNGPVLAAFCGLMGVDPMAISPAITRLEQARASAWKSDAQLAPRPTEGGAFAPATPASRANTGQPPVDLSSIGLRCAWARSRLGMSQADLAKRAQVSQGTIGNIESGWRKSPRELLEIAQALAVRPEWLKDGIGPIDVGALPATAERCPSLRWEDLPSLANLPDEFWLALGDDAMGPRAPSGSMLRFRRVTNVDLFRKGGVVIGDAVLLRASNGTHHVRCVVQSASLVCAFAPSNPAFTTFQGDSAGLDVLGVMTAVETRWHAYIS